MSELYRSRFINLDELIRTITSLSKPQRILEVGCGEGAVADRLARVYPAAEYVGLDIAPDPGRMFTGDRGRFEFRRELSSEFRSSAPQPFELVLLVDVFHHIPVPERVGTLGDLHALCAPGGLIVIKDWTRATSFWHLACYSADRYLTGDANVRYPSREELLQAAAEGLAGDELVCETRVPPRPNNLLLAYRRGQ